MYMLQNLEKNSIRNVKNSDLEHGLLEEE
jgi:hypothetical protein